MRSSILWSTFVCSAIVNTGRAQTLSFDTSVPTPGYVESRISYYDDQPGTLPVSGTGNIWDATGMIATGTTTTSIYQTPAASPFASAHPTATLVAMTEGNLILPFWSHWMVDTQVADLLGIDGDVFPGGCTNCNFPFDLGNSFFDDCNTFGNTVSTTQTYVASGSIEAPWGTITDVVMIKWDDGSNTVYYFYLAGNVLAPIGSLFNGGFQLDQLDLQSGIVEGSFKAISIWPSPVSDVAHLVVPFAGQYEFILEDPSNRRVVDRFETSSQMDLDVSDLVPGIYLAIVIGPGGDRRAARVVVN